MGDSRPGARRSVDAVRDLVWRALFGTPHADPRAMLEALWSELAASGVAIRRANVALRTLHPQLVGLGYVWQSGHMTVNEHVHGEFSLARFLHSPLRALFEGGGPLRYRLDGDQPLPFPVLDELRARGFTDYLGRALRFSDGECHGFTVATDAAAGFSDEECAVIDELTPMLALALEVHETRRVARTLLDVYVGARAGTKVLEGRIRRGDIQLIDAVLLCCDLRGFSALSFEVGPEKTVATLNAYFDRVCTPIVAAGGEVLKFIGDGLLAAFPSTLRRGRSVARRWWRRGSRSPTSTRSTISICRPAISRCAPAPRCIWDRWRLATSARARGSTSPSSARR